MPGKTQQGSVLTWVLVLVLFLGGALTAAAIYGYQWWEGQFEPVQAGSARPVRVRVVAGSTTQDVAHQLEAAGIIRSALAFRFYTREQRLDGQIKPGTYELSPNMTVAEIVSDLVAGRHVMLSLVVPEGATVTEAAAVMAQAGLAKADDVLALSRRRDLVADLLPAGASVRFPLEGYLFPATYRFPPETPVEHIIQTMVERFRVSFPGPFQARARELNLTIHQVVTLASIIEKEARLAAERPVIAGVYHNRLQEGMRLEADPTVRYAVAKPIREELTYDDLDSADPYNTYRHSGLPPGPIASPGEDALRAALWPAAHNYLFFVAKGDGSGAHRFSTTLAEHERNISQAEVEAQAANAPAATGR